MPPQLLGLFYETPSAGSDGTSFLQVLSRSQLQLRLYTLRHTVYLVVIAAYKSTHGNASKFSWGQSATHTRCTVGVDPNWVDSARPEAVCSVVAGFVTPA